MITDLNSFSLLFNSLNNKHCFSVSSTGSRGLHTLPTVPVKTYSNADINKPQIVEENRNKAGIYRWVNLINNKTYIGSSVNLSERLLDYFQMSQLLKNRTPITYALLKYGYSNFRLEILEYCKKNRSSIKGTILF